MSPSCRSRVELAPPYSRDPNDNIETVMQDPSGAYPETTAVTESGDRLYIQSLHAKTLGWMDKKQAGL